MQAGLQPKRFFQADQRRLIFLFIGAACFLITELFRIRLRPIFREYDINDWGFSDSIGNGGGILVQIFLAMAIMNPHRRQSYALAVFFTMGYIVYEFLQQILPKGTFDWNDVWASCIGGLISLFLLKIIWHQDDLRKGNWISAKNPLQSVQGRSHGKATEE